MLFQDLIDLGTINHDSWEGLYNLAADIKSNHANYSERCHSRIMATLFYEPSTRTQLSFQSAMIRLGGSVIGFSDPKSSSVAKGESFRDTIKIVSNYSDIVVIRSPRDGAAFAASLYTSLPVINAGDGSHLHPTQTLADLMTINEIKGRLNNLTIGICGDLLNGRTVHSLLKALSIQKNKYFLISTNELKLPQYIKKPLIEAGAELVEVPSIEDCIGNLDILYMTRIQRERFKSQEQYQKQASIFILDKPKMSSARDDLIILHPLPKIDEIAYDIDDDPRAKYFEQAKNGMYIRMALILSMLSNPPKILSQNPPYVPHYCKNPNCITNEEQYLPKKITLHSSNTICSYCETILS